MKLLIDGDIFAYRAAYSVKEPEFEAQAINKVDELLGFAIGDNLDFYNSGQVEVYITGKDNYRNDIAISHPYKGTRKGKEKPPHLEAIYQNLRDKWSAKTSDNQEADDDIGIRSTDLRATFSDFVVVTVDKDMLQLPGKHYNPTTRIKQYKDETEAFRFFCSQLLTGDAVDNIKCLFGIGPAKADKILSGCKTKVELLEAVVQAYKDKDLSLARLEENGKLLWLRRYEGQMWTIQDYLEVEEWL